MNEKDLKFSQVRFIWDSPGSGLNENEINRNARFMKVTLTFH